jgi:hypothetical protein
MYQNYHRALKRIGINRTEARSRGLSLHAWRHFLNTELQVAGVPVSKVQSVTGHKSDRMTEWYTHFDAKEFADVRQAQEALIQPDRKKKQNRAKQEQPEKTEKSAALEGRETVIPFRGKATAQRKQA